MSGTDLLGAAWRDYRTKVIPVDASPGQATESRRAFYAGATAFFTALTGHLVDEPSELDLKLIGDLIGELNAFAQRIRDGLA